MSKQGTSNPGVGAKRVGADEDTLKVEDINSDLLKEMLAELEAQTQLLRLITGVELEQDKSL